MTLNEMKAKQLAFILLSTAVALASSSHAFCTSKVVGVSQRSIETLDKQPRTNHGGREKIPLALNRDRTNRIDDILRLRAGAGAFAGLGPVGSLLQANPYAAAFCICGVKAAAADLIAQKSTSASVDSSVDSSTKSSAITVPGPKPQFDFQRNLAFIVYGGIYQGCFQEFLFNRIFPILFGRGSNPATVGKKVMFDMLVVSPFLCLPVAYMSKAIVYRYSCKEAVRRYIFDVKNNNLLKKYWTIWGPVQTATFTLVPEHLRITFIAGVSFFWLILLSSISSKK